MAVKSLAKKKAKKSVRSGGPAKTAAVDGTALTHHLDALLHTMRCIAQHEDELCTLLHDARRSAKLSKSLVRELQALLERLPGKEYSDDLEAVLSLTAAA